MELSRFSTRPRLQITRVMIGQRISGITILFSNFGVLFVRIFDYQSLYIMTPIYSYALQIMTDDPRDSGSHLPASTPSTDPKKPKHEFPQSQVGKLWDAFGNPEEPVNALANSTFKPRGKDPKDVSYSDVVGSLSVSEISSFYKAPCARESLLTGIGAGFGIGGIRGVFGGI